jgi:hypothetical protein
LGGWWVGGGVRLFSTQASSQPLTHPTITHAQKPLRKQALKQAHNRSHPKRSRTHPVVGGLGGALEPRVREEEEVILPVDFGFVCL